MNGLDAPVQREEPGVHVSQQLVGKPDIARDDPVEVFEGETRGVDPGQCAESGQFVRRHAGAGDLTRTGKEVALEQCAPHAAVELEFLRGLDLLGQQANVIGAQAGDDLGCPSRPVGQDIELDQVSPLDQGCQTAVIGEVVEGYAISATAKDVQPMQERVVGVVGVLGELEHHAARLQRQRIDVKQEAAGDIDVGERITHESVEAQLGKAVDDQGGRPALRIGHLSAGPAEEELVAVKLKVAVDDRLPSDQHLGASDHRHRRALGYGQSGSAGQTHGENFIGLRTHALK